MQKEYGKKRRSKKEGSKISNDSGTNIRYFIIYI